MTPHPFPRRLLLMAVPVAQLGCSRPVAAPPSPETLAALPWLEVEGRARGSQVRFAMWSGDENRNRFFREDVREALMERCGIRLELVPAADVAEVVNQLLNAKAAGKGGGGSVDLVWINGENFRTARQGGLLWGPFAHLLPNLRLYDAERCAVDFGTPVEGYEAPWLQAQFVMAYDTARMPEAPLSFPALRQWMEAHPGRFTYPAPPDFTGSAFVRHLLLYFGKNAAAFRQGFDEALYVRAAKPAFAWLREVKPLLWQQGATYPSNPQELNRLFANREVDFTMNYSPMFASQAIQRGEFPATTRTFVFETGTIGNYSFLAIPFNASNAVGAAVTANYLMSPEHLLAAARTLGGPYPHSAEALSPELQSQVRSLPRHGATLPDSVLAAAFVPEPDAEYLVRLEKDWRSEVLLA